MGVGGIGRQLQFSGRRAVSWIRVRGEVGGFVYVSGTVNLMLECVDFEMPIKTSTRR